MSSTLLFSSTCLSSNRTKSFNPSPKFIKLVRRNRTKASELTSKTEFEKKVLQSRTPSVVIFSAPWCIHSVTMKPRMHRLAAEFSGQATVYLVDADTNSWTREYVQTFPTIINFRAGKEVFRSSGTVDYSVIKRNLEMELRKK